MSVYNGTIPENSQKSLEFYSRITDRSVFALSGAFPIDKVKLLFRTFDKTAASGNKAKQTIEFFMSIPEFELLCHNILTGNLTKRLQRGDKIEPYYKGSTRPDGSVSSRVMTISSSDKGTYFTVYEGPGRKTQTGAITPAFDFKGNDHIKLYSIMSPEELKMFAIQGKRACDFYYLHYFGRS